MKTPEETIGVKHWVLALAMLAVLIVAARLRTYNLPHAVDVCFYATAGHGLLHGQQLYSQIWDQKPPAPYLLYAAAELLFGYGALQVFMLGVFAALAGLFGVYLATRELANDIPSSLWASVFWVVLSSSRYLDSFEPNCEVFINAILVWAFYLILRAGDHRSGRIFYVVGLLFAFATMFKPIFIVHAVLFAAAYLLSAEPGKRLEAAEDVVHMATVGAVTWAGTICYFAFTGRWQIFFDSMVTYNLYYSPQPLLSIVNGVPYLVGEAKDAFFVQFLPVLLLILGAYVLGRNSLGIHKRRVFAAYIGATYITVAMPGKFFGHYFQLWLPLLAVAAGWAISRMQEFKIRLPLKGAAFAVIALLALVLNEAPSYFLSPEQLSKANYGMRDVSVYRLAGQLNHFLLPNENIAQIGWNTGLYFATGRISPTGVLFAVHLEGPLGEQLTQRMMADIQRSRPEMVVIEAQEWRHMRPALLNLIQSNYAESSAFTSELTSMQTKEVSIATAKGSSPAFTILLRKGGTLETRIANRASFAD